MQRLVALFSLLIAINLHAQQFGATPPSLKWKQINTDSARIIFPEGLDSTAQRVAAVVHYMAESKPASLGSKIHKIDIVLRNQTTIGNGYVGLGPFRSEFYLTPVRDNFSEGSISWTDQLALHEYRHVQQFNNFRNGVSKALYYIFGEEGLAVAINASVPDWFYEGDAVYTETLLSNQGRGRLPAFLNNYPALWRANKNYSWMKLRNGSYKDFVPSHYALGYLLVNYGRKEYGSDFWEKVTRDASAYKSLIYPFQSAIKRHAGVEYKTFRNAAFNYYKQQDSLQVAAKPEYVHPVNEKYVTSYSFPYSISADSLLYLKSSYRHRPAFYIKDKEGEHRLRVKDIAIDEQFSYRNGRIVYAAYKPNARWGWKDYSDIKLLDVATGKQQSITSRAKYFTPDISADGEKIVAVQTGDDGKSELHILNTKGEVLNVIRSSEIQLFTDPKFIDSNNLVTAVRLKDGKMALALAEISSGNTMRLTAPSFNVVGYPSVNNGVVYFTASYAGNDDVFAVRLSDKKLFRISNGPLGNYQVNAANGKITWTNFTAEGYQLRQVNENQIVFSNPLEEEKNLPLQPKLSVAHPDDQEEILLNSIPTTREFPVTKYRKGTGLLNFHSWRPYYEDPVFTYSIYGENVLSTFQTELYYLYNENERTSAVGFNAIYGGLFPYISAGTEFTFNRVQPVGNLMREFNQLDSRIGLSVPLNLTGGQWLRNLNIGTNYVYRREYTIGLLKDSLRNNGFSYLHHFASFNQQVQRAVQHIYPRLGYGINLNHRYVISDLESWQFLATGHIYLPGIAANHNLVLTGAFQERDTLATVFGDRFAYPRGYTGRYFSRMWRASANYHLPVWHVDKGFANILYFHRLRANVFYDHGKVYSTDKTMSRNQRSTGVEIFVDTQWWNQYPLTFGIRFSSLIDPDQYDGRRGNVVEFILPVSIIPR